MERFNALGRGMQLMLVGAVVLFIDLFLPWQRCSGPDCDEIEAAGGDLTRTAFHGFGGWVLGLLTLVLIAWLVARLAAVEIPIPVSAAMTAAVLAFLILAIAVIKALVDDFSGWAAWVGIALAIVIAVGAWLQIQESGGIETLKSELPTMATPGASAPAPPTPEPPAPPPSAPAAPPPPPTQAERAPDEPSSPEERAT